MHPQSSGCVNSVRNIMKKINKRKRFWVMWDFKTPAYDVSELLINEINDILEERKIKINYTWSKQDRMSDDYKINLKLKSI